MACLDSRSRNAAVWTRCPGSTMPTRRTSSSPDPIASLPPPLRVKAPQTRDTYDGAERRHIERVGVRAVVARAYFFVMSGEVCPFASRASMLRSFANRQNDSYRRLTRRQIEPFVASERAAAEALATF